MFTSKRCVGCTRVVRESVSQYGNDECKNCRNRPSLGWGKCGGNGDELQYCAKVMIANFVEFRRSSTKFYVNLRNFEENEFSAKFRWPLLFHH